MWGEEKQGVAGVSYEIYKVKVGSFRFSVRFCFQSNLVLHLTILPLDHLASLLIILTFHNHTILQSYNLTISNLNL